MKKIDIVTPVIGSKFVRTLRDELEQTFKTKVFRRNTPKRLKNGSIRPHFAITFNPRDKIEQFQRFARQGISSPRFALSSDDASKIECKTLFARTIVNGTNGRGIVEFERTAPVYPRAPLYTEYIPKKAEYRFHVFNNQVIDVQQKKKKRQFDEGDRDTRIRNLNNGYVYCRDNIVPPAGADRLAIQAVQALNYRYGAVDVIYNEKQNKCFVLEVNSRPGLMGTTLQKYVNAIGSMLNLEKK